MRAIQEKRFRALGSDEERESDCRLVAATNKDLDNLAREGGFQQDLLFCIKGIHIEFPPWLLAAWFGSASSMAPRSEDAVPTLKERLAAAERDYLMAKAEIQAFP